MSAVDLLREKILNDRVIVPLVDGTVAEKKSVVLCEEKAGTVFTVRGLPANSIVIRADEFPETKCFFKNTEGEASRADFIIISDEDKTKKWIIYIEIKKGDSNDCEKIVQQFKGAQCVMAYCTSVVENFHNISEFLKPYKPRFVRIKDPNVNKQPNKQPTRRPTNKREIHNTPDKMLKIRNRPKSHFTELVHKGNYVFN